MSNLKEISNMYAKKQPKQVDAITVRTPILSTMPFEAASHGLWNVFEDVESITGASFVDIDAALPTVGMTSNLKQTNLSIMGGQMVCPEDKAKMFGGKEKYFARQLPAVLKQSGMSAEYSILYNTFRQYAIDNSMAIEPASATGDSNFTILCVRYEQGVTTGLYSPDGFEQGAMLNVEAINGGNLYDIGNGVLGYGIRLKGYFGIQVANPKTVAAIVNINSTHIPTAVQIDDTIASIEGSAQDTFLYMHDRAKSLIQTLKEGYMQMTVTENNVNRVVSAWQGVPIITSWNFLNGTEPDVTL